MCLSEKSSSNNKGNRKVIESIDNSLSKSKIRYSLQEVECILTSFGRN